mmetsp:Transcript_62510/g.86374  ORF Transcript_62510/g.86374 Transcript_62510/m.86374 type:complete len:128 (+) Transcript_62510:48-431(+)
MNKEYVENREEFDFTYWIIGLVGFVILYKVLNLIQPAEPMPDLTQKKYSIDEIRKFDGAKGPEDTVYIGLMGYVFDVSSSPNFRAGGMYEKFAGREISIACANYSTEEKFLDEIYDPETTVLDTTKQ